MAVHQRDVAVLAVDGGASVVERVLGGEDPAHAVRQAILVGILIKRPCQRRVDIVGCHMEISATDSAEEPLAKRWRKMGAFAKVRHP